MLPAGFRLGDNDTRILAVALNLAAEGADVTLVSKDLPLRVKASAVGLPAEEYRAELAVETGWTGMGELEVTGADLDRLYAEDWPSCEAARDLPCHTGLVLLSERGSGLGPGRPPTSRCGWCAATATRSACTAAAPSSGSRSTCCSTPTSASCRSAAGPAPASRRWRCAPGSRRCSSAAQHRKVVVFRPLYAVGGQELGYLPGNESEKM